MLETELFKSIVNNGPFAILFVWLLIYVMKRNAEREDRLHDILDKFSDKYDVVIDELRDIKDKISGGGRK